MSKEPRIVSAQAWECVCGRVNGRPEVEVCACGDYTLAGSVEKPRPPLPDKR